MLVLTRKLGQKVMIGDDIAVTIVTIDENRVKIGIDAPNSVRVYRQELIDKIKQSNLESVHATLGETKKMAGMLKKILTKIQK